jgi:predicted dehydrogenase
MKTCRGVEKPEFWRKTLRISAVSDAVHDVEPSGVEECAYTFSCAPNMQSVQQAFAYPSPEAVSKASAVCRKVSDGGAAGA